MEDGLKGLEATRRIDFEDWLDAQGIDAVVLPAAADVGPADADINEASAALAWRNGTWVANGNLVWRHFGIPTVTVPMGTMADIGMPVGLTFAGKAYDDERLLRMAGDYERATQRRTSPPRTPELADDVFSGRPSQAGNGKALPLAIALSAETRTLGDQDEITIMLDLPVGSAEAENASLKVHVNGEPVAMQRSGARFSGRALVPAAEHRRFHSVWRGPYGSIVTAEVRLKDGRTAGAYAVTGGIG
jgi:amidase